MDFFSCITPKMQESLIGNGLITSRKHPVHDLWVLNYTPKVQFEKLWTDDLRQIRGVIVDEGGNILYRGMPKFFNIQEVSPDWKELKWDRALLCEKMDGSLGILYKDPSTVYGWSIATRGSFTSEQAIEGTQILEKYIENGFTPKEDRTYLFEIIGDTTRVVVDYKGVKELVYLGHVLHGTNEFTPSNDNDEPLFRKPKRISVRDIRTLKIPKEEEGYVIHMGGEIFKIKGEDYVRLHGILTELSARKVWEHVRSGKPDSDFLQLDIPDEFYQWIKDTARRIRRDYNNIRARCAALAKEARQVVSIEVDSGDSPLDFNAVKRLQQTANFQMIEYINSKTSVDAERDIAFSIIKSTEKIVEQKIYDYLKPAHELPRFSQD